MSISHDIWTKNRRLGHANFELLDELNKCELVDDLLKLKFIKDMTYDACQKGKQTNYSFKLKNRF